MLLDDYTKLMCEIMEDNYDKAANIESMFQRHFNLKHIEDCQQLVEDLAEEGDWPKKDDGEIYTPKELIDKVVGDHDFFTNMGLLIIVSRIWTRLEAADVLH